MAMMLTTENVREALHYDPETGIFTRLSTGKPTGRVSWCGYIEFGFQNRQYKAHAAYIDAKRRLHEGCTI